MRVLLDFKPILRSTHEDETKPRTWRFVRFLPRLQGFYMVFLELNGPTKVSFTGRKRERNSITDQTQEKSAGYVEASKVDQS